MTPRIFVQIASYRDPDLAATVASALDMAAEPDRLRFGICHQYDDRTTTCSPTLAVTSGSRST